MPTHVKLELLPPRSPRVETIWRDLEERARPVYFLSWGWVENWLACLPALEAPRLAVLLDGDGAPVAAGFLGRQRVRQKLVPSRAFHLNAIGDEAFDELCVEHNGLLTAQPGQLAALVQLLPSWDELFLPALEARVYDELAEAALPAGLRLRVDREVGDHYVDLAKVRQKDYLSLLGSSTRAQLRKAQRLAADVMFEPAIDERHALTIYDELVELHQRAWKQKDQPGAFADPWFDGFHRRLIKKRFPHGEIQLIRVRTENDTIACLYNFVSNGRVLFYQSGVNSDVDAKVKPGMLAHVLAIENNAKLGHATYDFLGGDMQYKQQLGTDATKLVWARVQKKRLIFSLEDLARDLNRRRRAARARSSS